MKKVVLYGAMGLLISASAQADFQYELGAGYIDQDAGNSSEDGFVVHGTAYLESVDTSHGPLAEAAFLDKASGASITFTSVDDNDETAISGRYVFDSDYLVEAGYSDSDLDSEFGIGVGKYLTDTSDVVLSYSQTDDSDIDMLVLDLHAFSQISRASSFSYDLGFGFADSPAGDGHVARGGITYYGTADFGVGIRGERAEFGAAHVDEYGVNAEYFFSEDNAVSLDYSAASGSGGGDVDTLTLSFMARF